MHLNVTKMLAMKVSPLMAEAIAETFPQAGRENDHNENAVETLHRQVTSQPI